LQGIYLFPNFANESAASVPLGYFIWKSDILRREKRRIRRKPKKNSATQNCKKLVILICFYWPSTPKRMSKWAR